MDVSIIIVSYNCNHLLKDCVNSVRKYTAGISYEIIVVDNNSSDNTQSMLIDNFPSLIHIFNRKNYGFAYANNQGMRIAQGDCILLLNPDTVLVENSIQKTITFAKRKKEIGVVGCQLLNQDGSWQASFHGFPSVLSSFLESTFFYKFLPEQHIVTRGRILRLALTTPQRVDWVMGAFFLIKRQVIERIGFFDDQFFMYSEEMDYCLRAKEVGYEVWYYPMTSVHHLWGGMNSLTKRSVAWVTISRNIFLQKHYNKLHRIIIQCITDVGLSIRFFGYLLFGIILMRRKLLNKALNFYYALKYGGIGKTDYFKVP